MKNGKIAYTCERANFRKGNENLIQQSIKRYNFAKKYCVNKKVLDIASGEGYGSNIIADKANLVIAIDCDFETMKYSRNKYKKKNLYFICADCNNLPFRNACFDVITSFELIEHLSIPSKYLSEICRTILRNGIYIGSTPQILFKDLDKNPFHKHPYSKEEYKSVLLRYFSKVKILGEKDIRKISKIHLFLRRLDIFNFRNKLRNQFLRKLLGRMFGSTPFESVSQEDFIINEECIENAQILIAIANKPKNKTLVSGETLISKKKPKRN